MDVCSVSSLERQGPLHLGFPVSYDDEEGRKDFQGTLLANVHRERTCSPGGISITPLEGWVLREIKDQ
jgi:hypothetical protein